MLGIIYSAGIFRLEATPVKVEVDVANGLPGWQMVGLPEKAVQESKERVGAALRNSGIQLAARKTTINLAPATHKKSGNQYDLPIAMGVLLAHQYLEQADLKSFLFIGELSLTGELKPVHGALLYAILARQKGFKALVLPKANLKEAGLIKNLSLIGCESIAEVLDFLNKGMIPPSPVFSKQLFSNANLSPDFAEVQGQYLAKRAMEIAASGNHHVLLLGSPGSGKTMLAKRLPSILPSLSERQSLETTKIYSALGLTDNENPLLTRPPFRAPHHSISYSALIGGGQTQLQPGEITLAHNGILFLDELPEFRRDALQMLRQPLESNWVLIHRVNGRIRLPARVLLVACANPCKCGYLGHPQKPCTCDPGRVLQYRSKISGPLIDRIDLHVEVEPVTEKDLFEESTAESSATILQRVLNARAIQKERYKKCKLDCNGDLSHPDLKKFCPLDREATRFFRNTFSSLHLSARAHDRILKVARTISDLAQSHAITVQHIAEAAGYRTLDREIFF